MGIFRRRRTIGRSSLTKEDIDRLIDLQNPYRTDYSFVRSRSYRRDGPELYENPRMFRFPLDYYKRKWALEDAWNRGILVFISCYIMDFCSRMLQNPSTVFRGMYRVIYYFFYGFLSQQSRRQLDLSTSSIEKSDITTLSEPFESSQDAQYYEQRTTKMSAWQTVRRFFYRFARTVVYICTLGYLPRGYSSSANGYGESVPYSSIDRPGSREQKDLSMDWAGDHSSTESTRSLASVTPVSYGASSTQEELLHRDFVGEDQDFHTYHLRERTIHVPAAHVEESVELQRLQALDQAEGTSVERLRERRSKKLCPGICCKLLPLLLLLLLAFLIGRSLLGSSDEESVIARKVESLKALPVWLFGNHSEAWETLRYGGKSFIATLVEIPEKLLESVSYIFVSLWDEAGWLFHRIHGAIFYRAEEVEKCKPQEEELELRKAIEFEDYGRKAEERARTERESWSAQLTELRRERELNQEQYEQLKRSIELVQSSLPSALPPDRDERIAKMATVDEALLQKRIEMNILNHIINVKTGTLDSKYKSALDVYLNLRIDEISDDLENRIEIKLKELKRESEASHDAFASEIAEFGADIAQLHRKLETIKQERDLKLAELTHSMMDRDTQQREDFKFMLSTEIQRAVQEEVIKELEQRLSTRVEDEETSLYRRLLSELKVIILDLFAERESHLGYAGRIHEEKEIFVGDRSLSVSDLTAIRRLISEAIKKYDADKTSKVDYALESSGASVLSTRCTEAYKQKSRMESIFGFPLWYSSYSPRQVIQHRASFASGECWAFRGTGYLVIKLAYPVYVTEISYEHLPPVLHPDGTTKSAPKNFEIWSLRELDDLNSKFLIGEYEYDNSGEALQTFAAQHIPHDPSKIIELIVYSNWGSEYTCLYRLRVHGRKPMDGAIEPPPEVDHVVREETVKKTEPIHA